MITVRHASDRGQANFGWLQSRHTFSFGSYYDPHHMGFSALRVINDDIVSPAAGFDTHGHRDMEIISLVLEGAIEHKDSQDNRQTLPAGEFQLMSAGRGIYHSEYNASSSQPLRFLQIWIEPNERGGEPGYQQKDFGNQPGFTVIATPTGENGSLKIKQEARLLQLVLAPSESVTFALGTGRNAYVHQVAGTLKVENTSLSPGDGAKVEGIRHITFSNIGNEISQTLVFDLP
ncbi:pirin family protein [Salinivibrio sp. ML323]|uniref:pirin family protein n=1 Tax=unclassified Salinivibrio TaxID=2636825 RepID=UPI0009864BCF|nr:MULTISPECIES: pirin family protein [unclassified Salinivibrio]OOE57097.1 pirin family protein [Salinivibrio sp. ML323]OOE57617.1 pirin family protein [Salinivibrio sp. IB282]